MHSNLRGRPGLDFGVATPILNDLPDSSDRNSNPGRQCAPAQKLRQHSTQLITRDFRGPRPPRRPDFARSASVAYEFVHFGLGNREPETFRGARSLDARRDNPARPRRGSARHSATPTPWPTPRDLHARNPLSQSAVRTPQTRTPRPCGRGAHSEPFGAPVSRVAHPLHSASRR